MRGYMRGVREWSGLVLSGKDGSGGGSECHMTATSVSVEQLFSTSRHLCTDVRNSLKAETITQSMCTKYWIHQGLLGKI